MEIKQCILTKNDCYKESGNMTPKGIVVHSTGANNAYLKRYLAPDDGIIGKNQYANDWNHSGLSKCVHAFIGKDKNGVVRVYQTLPWTKKCWGCGKGDKGSYNSNYIQFEICEDALKDEKYFTEAFTKAVKLCAYLCEKYDISVNNIVSHKEAYYKGYASNHGDCDYWLKKFGKSMTWFRNEVEGEKKKGFSVSEPTKTEEFNVKVSIDDLNIRKGAGTNYAVVGVIAPGTYTITEVKSGKGSDSGWGKLKSGKGWISLDFAKKVESEGVPFKVRVSIGNLNIRKGPGTNYDKVKYIEPNVYTIVEVKSGKGSDLGWGRLKSGAGWISLDFVKRV